MKHPIVIFILCSSFGGLLGQVGIGTTDADGILHLDNGATNTDFVIEKDDAYDGDIIFHKDGTAIGHVGFDSNEHLYIEMDEQNTDIQLTVNDGGSETTLMYMDASVLHVGLGTTSPDEQLHVHSTGSGIAKIEGASTAASTGAELELETAQDYRGAGVLMDCADDSQWFFGLPYTGDGFTMGFHASQPFYDANSFLFIDEGGEVSLGNGTTPTRQLEVKDDVTGFAGYFYNDGNNVNRYGIAVQGCADDLSTTGIGVIINFMDGDGTDVGGIRLNSGTTEYYNSSDRRLKTNIQPSSIKGRQIIQGLTVRDYSYKNQNETITGFVAQEAGEIYPPMRSVIQSQLVNDLQIITPVTLIPVFVKTLQEQQSEIEKLTIENQNRQQEIESLTQLYQQLIREKNTQH